MTNDLPRAPIDGADCLRFEERLMAYLERDLADGDRDWMERHRSGCAQCGTLVRDLDTLVTEASALPAISPSRDLWSGIAERLDAPVVPLYARTPATPVVNQAQGPRSTHRSVSVRWFAIAATMLITVSSAVTWRIARGRPDATGTPVVATATRAPDTAVRTTNVLLAANAGDVYEQEITAMRAIVDQRFGELDSATVAELRRNLAIIDQAIADSRKALAKDPNSRVISTTLDRALETKLALMRRVALL